MRQQLDKWLLLRPSSSEYLTLVRAHQAFRMGAIGYLKATPDGFRAFRSWLMLPPSLEEYERFELHVLQSKVTGDL